jgi:hypothetical protein
MEDPGVMMAPGAEAGMAHTPSFNRSNSNPAARLAYERPGLILLAVLAVFAYYVVSGNYSFTRPLTAQETAPPLAETSAATFSADAGALTDSGVVSLNVDAVANEPAAAETISQLALQPQTAGQSPTIQAAAQRWAAGGITLVTKGQDWDETSLANIDAALSLLPPAVLSSLGNPELGALLVLVNQEGRSLSGSQPYGGAANYFSTNDGVNELVVYPGQRVTTILHELGHAYNLRAVPQGHYAQVLLDPEMESFLAATGWHILTPRETVATMVDHTQVAFDYTGGFVWQELSHFDPLEDYANTFAMYYADPEGLKAASPERYDWMAAHLPK